MSDRKQGYETAESAPHGAVARDEARQSTPAGQDRNLQQKKTFTRWVNVFLKERQLVLEDMQFGLADGVLLCNLLEILTGQKIRAWTPKPRWEMQKRENVNKALNHMKSAAFNLVNIGADDIEKGNLKIILGLIWLLILRYQIQKNRQEGDGGGSPKEVCIQFINNRIQPYGMHIDNLDSSFADGKVISALTHSMGGNPYDMAKLPGPMEATAQAMTVAEEVHGVPQMMDPQDLVGGPDELSVVTYISYFKKRLEDKKSEGKGPSRPSSPAAPASPKAEAKVDPAQSRFEGLEKEYESRISPFRVVSYDTNGAPLTKGGNAVVVHASWAPDAKEARDVKIALDVKDNGNGTYQVTHPVSAASLAKGSYHITATLNDVAIKDSPQSVQVLGSTPVAQLCIAEGPGLERTGPPTALATFTIHAKNADGSIKNGGDSFLVDAVGPGGASLGATVKDNGDGTYSGSYQPHEAGPHTVQISLNGEAIAGSPFSPIIENAQANKSYAEGDGLIRGRSGETVSFHIIAVDRDGKRRTDGGDPFRVEITNFKNGLKGTLAEGRKQLLMKAAQDELARAEADYGLELTPDNKAGLTIVEIARGSFAIRAGLKKGDLLTHIAGKPVKDMKSYQEVLRGYKVGSVVPLKIQRSGQSKDVSLTIGAKHTAPATIDALHRVASGKDIRSSDIDIPLLAAIPRKDAIAAMATLGRTKAHVSGDYKDDDVEPVSVQIHDNNDGSYLVHYFPIRPGLHDIAITLHGEPIGRGPYRAQISQRFRLHPKDAKGDPKPIRVFVDKDKGKLLWVPVPASAAGASPAGAAAGAGVPPLEEGKNGCQGIPLITFGKQKLGKKTPAFNTPAGRAADAEACFSLMPKDEAKGALLDLEAESSDAAVDFVNLLSSAAPNAEPVGAGEGEEFKADMKVQLPEAAAVDSPAAEKARSGDAPLKVQVSCRDLIKMDWLSKSDPMVAVLEIDPAAAAKKKPAGGLPGPGTGMRLLDQTEMIPNNHDPDFEKPLTIYYNPKKRDAADRKLRFVVYDVDKPKLGAEDVMGYADVTLGELMSAPIGRYPIENQEKQEINDQLKAKKSRIVLKPDSVVEPLNVDPALCYAHGPGLSNASDNAPAAFTIQSVGEDGKPVNKGGVDFAAAVRPLGANPDGSEDIPAAIVDNGDGTYAVTLPAPDAKLPASAKAGALPPGSYDLFVTSDDIPIKDFPRKIKVKKSDISPALCVASGPGVTVIRPIGEAPISIQARNSDGDLDHGGAKFVVNVTTPELKVLQSAVTDNKDGTYSCSYLPTTCGYYQVAITSNDIHIKDSPFIVKAQNASELHSFLQGPGVGQGGYDAKKSNDFTIHAHDIQGQPLKKGGDVFQVDVNNFLGEVGETPQEKKKKALIAAANSVLSEQKPWVGFEIKDVVSKDKIACFGIKKDSPAELAGLADGDFILKARDRSVNGAKAFQYALKGLRPGDEVALVVRDPQGNNKDATLTLGTTELQAPELTQLRRIARGQVIPSDYNNSRLKPLVDSVRKHDSGDVEDVKPVLKDNKNGTYTVSFQPKSPSGTVHIALSLLGEPCKGSPYIIAPKAVVSVPACTVKGKGLTKGRVSGKPTFKIYAQSSSGQPCSGVEFDVKVTNDAGKATPCHVVDQNDGSYKVQYEPTKAGTYNISIQHKNEALPGGPWTPVISSEVSDSKCKIEGLPAGAGVGAGAGAGPELTADDETLPSFTVYPTTEDGKPLLDGLSDGNNDGVEVYLIPDNGEAKDDEAGRIDAKIEDMGDGGYKVTLPKNAGDGKFKVKAKVDGKPLSGFPWGLNIPKIKWGKKPPVAKFTFTVRGLDADGKPRKTGGGDFKVKVTGPDGSMVPVKTKDKGDGNYYAAYQLRGILGGVLEYTVDVTLDGVRLLNSPFKHVV